MAKENSFRLYGQIIASPNIYFNNKSEPKRGDFMIKVWRRADGNNRFFDTYSYDCPVIMSRNKDNLKLFTGFKKGNMVLIDGVICSRAMKKVSICDNCKGENENVGLIVWVDPIMVMPLNEGLTESEGNELLQSYTEVSNKGFVIGRLCKDPEMFTREDERGKVVRITQYLICIERHYRIKEDEAERKQDFIWVKTYGKQAELDYECLSKGSYVYINGALQTRNIVITRHCEHCGAEYKVNEAVTEIVPYSVEYLENWNRPSLVKEEEETNDEDVEQDDNDTLDENTDEDSNIENEENENKNINDEEEDVSVGTSFGAFLSTQD